MKRSIRSTYKYFLLIISYYILRLVRQKLKKNNISENVFGDAGQRTPRVWACKPGKFQVKTPFYETCAPKENNEMG